MSRTWPAHFPFGQQIDILLRRSSPYLNVVGRRRRLYTHYSSPVVDRASTNPSADPEKTEPNQTWPDARAALGQVK